ncbi:MAG: MarR family transcriptional regulator [Akkermansiaceae bacterium]|nr:MarR family transcriptional regulator [Akkermansiaceae bacterium]
MEQSSTDKTAMALHRILTVFDDIRRKILHDSAAPLQKKLYGLTLRQGAAINQVMVLTMSQPEGVSLKTLAKHLQMAVSATSLLVEGMVTKGLLVRTPSQVDRRAICIRLSPRGEEIFRETHSVLLREMSELTSVLSEEELAALTSASLKLRDKAFNNK